MYKLGVTCRCCLCTKIERQRFASSVSVWLRTRFDRWKFPYGYERTRFDRLAIITHTYCANTIYVYIYIWNRLKSVCMALCVGRGWGCKEFRSRVSGQLVTWSMGMLAFMEFRILRTLRPVFLRTDIRTSYVSRWMNIYGCMRDICGGFGLIKLWGVCV